VAPLAWRTTSRNAINDHCEVEIGLKRTIGPRRKAKGHTTMHHTPTSARMHANRAQIARQMQCNFKIPSSDGEFSVFFGGTTGSFLDSHSMYV
jgi:hypothetical protein